MKKSLVAFSVLCCILLSACASNEKVKVEIVGEEKMDELRTSDETFFVYYVSASEGSVGERNIKAIEENVDRRKNCGIYIFDFSKYNPDQWMPLCQKYGITGNNIVQKWSDGKVQEVFRFTDLSSGNYTQEEVLEIYEQDERRLIEFLSKK